ncbi:MAG: STAS domain-containing protein [Chloroflexi bacterium]|nr:STAS domain-containing protein [Chloroflexota bacterium]
MIATLNVRELTFTPVMEQTDKAQKPIPIMQVSGRLDASTVSILERALLRAFSLGAKAIVIDMGEVTYISSSGLRVLLTARRQARERGGDILLCALSPNVRDVLDMVGFTALFSICSTLDDAKQMAGHLPAT